MYIFVILIYFYKKNDNNSDTEFLHDISTFAYTKIPYSNVIYISPTHRFIICQNKLIFWSNIYCLLNAHTICCGGVTDYYEYLYPSITVIALV